MYKWWKMEGESKRDKERKRSRAVPTFGSMVLSGRSVCSIPSLGSPRIAKPANRPSNLSVLPLLQPAPRLHSLDCGMPWMLRMFGWRESDLVVQKGWREKRRHRTCGRSPWLHCLCHCRNKATSGGARPCLFLCRARACFVLERSGHYSDDDNKIFIAAFYHKDNKRKGANLKLDEKIHVVVELGPWLP